MEDLKTVLLEWELAVWEMGREGKAHCVVLGDVELKVYFACGGIGDAKLQGQVSGGLKGAKGGVHGGQVIWKSDFGECLMG